ncbi:Furin repeat-containing protein [Entamoeba marina]
MECATYENGKCTGKPVENCESYNDGLNRCSRCEEGYCWNEELKKCISSSCVGCRICSNTEGTECDECYYDNYYKDENNICQEQTIEGCNTYYSKGGCYYCEDGYRKNESNICEPCEVEYCNKCNDNVTTCSECSTGYYINSNECHPCPSNCVGCSYDDETATITCNSCDSNYGLINNECNKCEDTSCRNCDGDTTLCRRCLDDSYILTNFTCDKCNEKCEYSGYDFSSSCTYLPYKCRLYENGCEEIDENGDCIKCDDDFTFENNKCYPYFAATGMDGLDYGCYKFDPDTFENAEYISIYYFEPVDGHYENGNCTGKPVENCKSYKNSRLSACYMCEEGYCWNEELNKCIISSCGKCRICSNTEGTECDECYFNNYYYKDENNICQEQTMEGCDWYDGINICDTCEDCYRKNESNICEPCEVEGCMTCTDNVTTCSECLTGYYIDSNECHPCPSNCASCSYDDETATITCNSCDSNYGIINNVCKKCEDTSCKNCDGDTTLCRRCLDDSYILTNFTCDTCNEKCKSSNYDSSSCIYLPYKCYLYENGCEEIDENGDCIECDGDFTLDNNKCYTYFAATGIDGLDYGCYKFDPDTVELDEGVPLYYFEPVNGHCINPFVTGTSSETTSSENSEEGENNNNNNNNEDSCGAITILIAICVVVGMI